MKDIQQLLQLKWCGYPFPQSTGLSKTVAWEQAQSEPFKISALNCSTTGCHWAMSGLVSDILQKKCFHGHIVNAWISLCSELFYKCKGGTPCWCCSPCFQQFRSLLMLIVLLHTHGSFRTVREGYNLSTTLDTTEVGSSLQQEAPEQS